jgi:hypothetical protein
MCSTRCGSVVPDDRLPPSWDCPKLRPRTPPCFCPHNRGPPRSRPWRARRVRAGWPRTSSPAAIDRASVPTSIFVLRSMDPDAAARMYASLFEVDDLSLRVATIHPSPPVDGTRWVIDLATSPRNGRLVGLYAALAIGSGLDHLFAWRLPAEKVGLWPRSPWTRARGVVEGASRGIWHHHPGYGTALPSDQLLCPRRRVRAGHRRHRNEGNPNRRWDSACQHVQVARAGPFFTFR